MNHTTQATGFTTNFLTNPIIRRLGKVEEHATDGNVATYSGIIGKTLYFLLMTVVGIMTCVILNSLTNFSSIFTGGEVNEQYSTLSLFMLLGIIVALILTILTPLLAWMIRPTVPVTGTLYTLSQGYLLAIMCLFVGEKYTKLAWMALILTVIIVCVMLFLYMKRIIHITNKFNSVVRILFFSSIAACIAVAVLGFIPATSGVTQYIMANPVISIGASVLFIIIAALFLLSDFHAIEQTVENQLPKKYEWMAAFGLAFTIIWLYLKVLSLLSKLQGEK